jgi:uncharacterized tellurite resistance protein B-like protein
MSDATQIPPLPSAALELHVRQMAAIAELLMGAAHADGAVSWPERSTIAQVLTDFLGHRELPTEVDARLKSFDVARFDLEAACRNLSLPTSEDRVALLGLLSRVVDADALLVEGEANYLRRVATAIGATNAELNPFLACDTGA